MERVWFITIAAVIFLILAFLFYKSITAYVNKTYGNKWLKIWGNKIYFWQSWLFVSLASTALIMYVLHSSNIVTI